MARPSCLLAIRNYFQHAPYPFMGIVYDGPNFSWLDSDLRTEMNIKDSDYYLRINKEELDDET